MEKPTVKFRKIMKFLRFCGSLVGCDIFKENFHINWLTVLVAMSIITYFIFSFMTAAKLYHEDWKVMLEATCMASSVGQGGVKMTVAIAKSEKLVKISDFLDRVYLEYEQKDKRYVQCLNESCKRVIRALKIIFLPYFIPSLVMVLLPFLLLILTEKRYLIMQFHFPGIDISTTSGYFATLGTQCLFMFAGSFGLYSGDLITIIYLSQSFLFADIFRLKIEDLNNMVSSDKPCNERDITMALNDIVKWHQTYSSYTIEINSTFYYIVTAMVTTSGVSIVFSLFIILTGNWPGAYPYLFLTTYTLYVYCILGTKIDTTNDNFCNEIYNISWYKLNVSQQKTVKLMLQQSQHPHRVYVAGVLPLSVSTALQITKTIYSIFMMMVQFLME